MGNWAGRRTLLRAVAATLVACPVVAVAVDEPVVAGPAKPAGPAVSVAPDGTAEA